MRDWKCLKYAICFCLSIPILFDVSVSVCLCVCHQKMMLLYLRLNKIIIPNSKYIYISSIIDLIATGCDFRYHRRCHNTIVHCAWTPMKWNSTQKKSWWTTVSSRTVSNRYTNIYVLVYAVVVVFFLFAHQFIFYPIYTRYIFSIEAH